jgi:hypothetical protein
MAAKKKSARKPRRMYPQNLALRMVHYLAPLEKPVDSYQYRGRIAGVASSVRVSDYFRGVPVCLIGRFVIVVDGKRQLSERIEVPDAVGAEVQEQLDEHRPPPWQRRTLVFLEYDFWTVPKAGSLTGHEIVADGRAWVPDALADLIERAATKPTPKHPEAV